MTWAKLEQTSKQAHRDAENADCPPASGAATFVYSEPERCGPPPAQGGRETTFVAATHEALAEAMARDDSIFVLGEGIGERGGNFMTTTGLYEKYGPERLCDTPAVQLQPHWRSLWRRAVERWPSD